MNQNMKIEWLPSNGSYKVSPNVKREDQNKNRGSGP